MRTNVEIDDRLMADALEASGLPSKKAVVEAALRLLIRMDAQRQLLELGGKIEYPKDWNERRKREGESTKWDRPLATPEGAET